ncbi:MAG: type II secretion system F family protein, partial [Pseudomonadota bacterium]
MEALINTVTDRQFQIALLVSMAAIATIYTILEPFIVKDKLKERMKSVADYRERLREEHRASLNAKKSASLRTSSAQGALKEIVENLKLFEIFDAEEARKKLMMAGYRGTRPVFVFMAARLGMPFVLAIGVAIYMYFVTTAEYDNLTKLLACLGGFFGGFYLPNLYVDNQIQKRQQVIQLAWPDALDLLLICVEAGMSIEAALQKVGEEVGTNAPELAEELGLTVAELSYLQDRRHAYQNLAERTGLEGVKGVTTALVQSEKY